MRGQGNCSVFQIPTGNLISVQLISKFPFEFYRGRTQFVSRNQLIWQLASPSNLKDMCLESIFPISTVSYAGDLLNMGGMFSVSRFQHRNVLVVISVTHPYFRGPTSWFIIWLHRNFSSYARWFPIFFFTILSSYVVDLVSFHHSRRNHKENNRVRD